MSASLTLPNATRRILASLTAIGMLLVLMPGTAAAALPTVPPGFTIHVVATVTPAYTLQDVEPGPGNDFGTFLYYVVVPDPYVGVSQIYRVNPWGGSPSPFATISGGLTRLRFGFDGDLYAVVGQLGQSSTIYRIKADGSSTVFSTSSTTSSDGLAYSSGGAFGNQLFISEFNDVTSAGYPIYSIAPNGGRSLFVRVADSAGLGNRLTGLEFGPGGNFGSDLFAIFVESGNIYKVSPAKTASQFVVTPATGTADTLAFGSPSNLFGEHLFVAKDYSGDLYQIAPDGTASVFASGFAGFRYEGVTGLKFSPDKKMLFVTDDNAGVIYAITFPALTCVGFDPPMNAGPVRVNKNRALPLKAQLFDSAGTPITAENIGSVPPVVQVTYESTSGGGVADVTSAAVPVGLGTAGNEFVFADGLWQFNLSTKGFTAPGTYTVTMAAGNSYFVMPTCTASFVIQ